VKVRDRGRVLADHNERFPALESARARLVAYLEYVCRSLSEQDNEFHYRLIEARVKSPSSVIRQLEKKKLGADRIWSDVNDVIGARVVVVTKRMARTLRDRLHKAKDSPFVVIRVKDMGEDEDAKTRGYNAYHIKGEYKTSHGNVGCEIQIRTALEDAWGVITRSDVYEGVRIPPEIASDAKELSVQLQSIDRQFETLLKRVREARLAEKTSRARRVGASADVPEASDLTFQEP